MDPRKNREKNGAGTMSGLGEGGGEGSARNRDRRRRETSSPHLGPPIINDFRDRKAGGGDEIGADGKRRRGQGLNSPGTRLEFPGRGPCSLPAGRGWLESTKWGDSSDKAASCTGAGQEGDENGNDKRRHRGRSPNGLGCGGKETRAMRWARIVYGNGRDPERGCETNERDKSKREKSTRPANSPPEESNRPLQTEGAAGKQSAIRRRQ